MLEILNLILLLLLLTVTVFIVLSKHLVVSAVLMCVFSSIIALMYLIMNAPDVAITEASVGAGLSTVFTFAALSLVKNYKANLSHSPTTLFFMLFLTACLSYFMIQLPDFGSHNAPVHLHVAPYYVESTEKAIGIPNIVTAVLASFRGYDTFGETIVVFTAALCIMLILEEKESD
ncbi:DUF4040 domain-containing protein [Wolbachia endosymbiont of Tetranychus urticae]|uniref:DUF4040 domain-containing protein n=1 Tax=Wolbachia endosymbiont of Tetranychus urticae TaxID=169184 RepID=UPI00397C8723